MNTADGGKIIRVTATAVTGAIALSRYAGARPCWAAGSRGALGARLPFERLCSGGYGIAGDRCGADGGGLGAAGRSRYRRRHVFGAGLLLVAWIAVELFIKACSWFHPTYLLAAIVVLGLGWLMTELLRQPSRRQQAAAETPTWLDGHVLGGLSARAHMVGHHRRAASQIGSQRLKPE